VKPISLKISLKSPRFIVRSILVLVYVAILLLMLVTGKQHTILIDNKDAEDGSYLALDGISVQIDTLESSEYYPGDRDKALVIGQKHSIKVEVFSDGKIVEADFAVPFGQDMVLLSVPAFLSGVRPYIKPFTIQQEQAQVPDSGPPQGYQFGGDSPVLDEAEPVAPVLIQ
jgi:hypothetical protein